MDKTNEINFRIKCMGDFVRRKQKSERFTNREILRITGIPEQTIVNVKNGNNTRLSTLLMICDVIGIDISLTDRTTGDSITI